MHRILGLHAPTKPASDRTVFTGYTVLRKESGHLREIKPGDSAFYAEWDPRKDSQFPPVTGQAEIVRPADGVRFTLEFAVFICWREMCCHQQTILGKWVTLCEMPREEMLRQIAERIRETAATPRFENNRDTFVETDRGGNPHGFVQTLHHQAFKQAIDDRLQNLGCALLHTEAGLSWKPLP